MRALIALVTALLVMFWATVMADEAYINGNWYDGSGFVERTVYVTNGRFSFAAPEQIDNSYDLAGTYVIPPFAEAHNHDLTTDFEPQERINEYLRDGVFYAKMQSAFSKGFEKLAPHFNKPGSLDVKFAFAPITGPAGHPIRIRELFFIADITKAYSIPRTRSPESGIPKSKIEKNSYGSGPTLFDRSRTSSRSC